MLSNELFMNRCLDQGANIPLQIPARSMPTVYAIRPRSAQQHREIKRHTFYAILRCICSHHIYISPVKREKIADAITFIHCSHVFGRVSWNQRNLKYRRWFYVSFSLVKLRWFIISWVCCTKICITHFFVAVFSSSHTNIEHWKI